MKKTIIFFVFYFFLHFLSAQTSVTVTAGNLWSAVNKNAKAGITDITIKGTIDSRDFKQLKDSFPALKHINISAATVVAFNGVGANTIPDNAFLSNSILTSIELPSNLTTIGTSAFNGCISIQSIHLPSTISTINNAAFRNFGGFFTVEASNQYFSDFNGVLYDKNQAELIQCPLSIVGNYTLPTTVTSIKIYSFYGCNQVTGINSAGTNALTIEDYAFIGCTGLINFYTNASTTTLGTSSFENCKNLTTFTANNLKVGSRSFLSSGITTLTASIIEVSGLSFYACTKLKTVTFSSPINTIPNLAFYACYSLNTINLPASITTLETNCFGACTNLSTVSGALISLSDGAFSGCSSLIAVNAVLKSIEINAFYNCSSLTSIIIDNDLTSIGNLAFYGCTKLPSFTVSGKVTTIGDGAFRNCSARVSVDAANTKYGSHNGVLYDKNFTTLIQSPTSNAATYTIPDGVVTIKSYSFFNNSKLEYINIPQSVCNIEPAAFLNCSVKKITISTNNTCTYTPDGLVIFNTDSTKLIYCSPLKTGNYTLPKTVVEISEFAFTGCNKLTSITLNNGLKIIGNNAFENCGINSITIPSSVNILGNSAFLNCKNASTLNFFEPSSLQNISNNAFAGCNKISSVILPSGLESIGMYAFSGCKAITSFSFPSVLKTIGDFAFTECTLWSGNLSLPNSVTSIGKGAFNGCSSLNGTLNLPPAITEIKESTFANCIGITALNISNITDIGNAAFNNCTGLTSVTIPVSVTNIGSYAFFNCKNITYIKIPPSLKNIGSYAFYGCSSLTSFYSDPVYPIDLKLSTEVFSPSSVYTNCTLFVPAGTKKEYKAANTWRNFNHIIEGFGFWIGKDSVFLSDIACSDSILIGSNTTWSTEVNSGSSNWLSSAPAVGNLDGKIYVSATENYGDQRIGYITVKTKDSADTITVVQSATIKIPDYDIKISSLRWCNHQKYNFKAVQKTWYPDIFTYEWDFGDSKTDITIKDTINHEFSQFESKKYNIKLTVRLGNYHRGFTSDFLTDSLPILILDNKPNLCKGDTMIVHIKGADNYIWNNGTKGDSIIITRSGTYGVQGIKNDTLCSFKSFIVDYFPTYDYTIQSNTNDIPSYLPLVHVWVEDIPGSYYQWEFEKNGEILEGNDVRYIFNNINEQDKFIKLTVTTPEGCSETSYKLITIIKSDVPNTFSPNGDGRNDVFLKDNDIQVFDRNGQLLYEGNNGWDGTYRGNKLPQGTYYYSIIFKTQKGKKVMSNYVMLIR